MRSPTSRMRACSALASWPAFFARPIASEATLRWALRSSTSLSRRRRSTSLARISGMSSAPPLSASARWTSSGRSRISHRSSTGLLGFGRGGAFGLDAGDRADLVVGVDDAHAHSVAALRRHVARGHADDLALRRDHEDVVAFADLEHAHDRAVAAAGLDVDDALARAALQPVLVERRALAVAPLGDGEDLRALLHDVARDDLVALLHLDAAHAAGAAAHRPHLVLGESDGHPELGGDHDLARAVRAARGDDGVTVLETDGLDAAGARVRIGLELRLLHLPLLRAEEDVAAAGAEVADGHARGHRLALAEREEVDHGLALGLPAALGDLVDLQPVHLAQIGEEEEVRVRRGDEEVLDDVLFLRLHARHALAPAALAAVGLDVRALDVPRARDGDDHFLVGEQVLDGEVGRAVDDLRAPGVAVLVADGDQLLLDDGHELGVGGEDALQLVDEGQHLLVLFDDLVALELGQALQAHVENSLGLDFREGELGHERFARGVGAVRGADEADDEVELLHRFAQTGEDVRPLFRAREVVTGPARDHLAAEPDEGFQHLLEIHDLRAAVDEREHDDAEARLHLRVLEELIQHDVGDLAPAELQHDADALAIRLVADLRDAADLLFLRQFGDLLDERGFVHLVRQLGDDDRLAAAPSLLKVRFRAKGEGAAARRVGIPNAVAADDVAGGGEIGPGDHRHQLLDGRAWIANEHHEGVHDLGEVVGRDVGGHAHRDARGAVDEQVRDARRQHHRLLLIVVVVWHEVDGVLLDVGQHLVRDLRHPRFRVAHGGGRIAVDGAEVPLPVDERIAQREILDHPHQRLVDRRVTVRVELAHAVAHDAGGLLVTAVPGQAEQRHRVEDTAVDGFEAVADVRQRASGDDGHRVVEIRVPHLLFDGGVDLAIRHLSTQVGDVEGVLLDELATRLDGVTHQDREHLVGADRILHGDLEERPRLRIHRRFPELLGVHLAEPLVALEGGAGARPVERHAPQLVQALHRGFGVVLVQRDRRALGDRGHLLPLLQQRGVVRRSEQLGAEGQRRAPRDHHRVRIAVVAGAHLDVVAVHRRGRRLHGGADVGVAHAAFVAAELLPQQLGEDGRRHAALHELAEEAAVLAHRAQQLHQRLAADGLLGARDLQLRRGHPRGEEEVLELAVVHEVLLDLALLDLEEGRLRDEEVARLDDRVHVAEEEREGQRPDVGTVHVRVSHQDDLVVAQLREVELVGPDASAHGGDEQPDFVVGQDLVVARLLRVDDLAAQREDGLRLAVAALLGRAAGRIALDQEQLAVLRVALRAVGQLGGQALVVAPALARELPGFPGRLSRLRGAHALVDDLARGRRIFLEGLGQLLVHDLLHEALEVGVAELGLRLPLELRIGQPHGDDGAEALADVVAGHPTLERLEVAVLLRVRRELAGERRAEAREVRAALARVDVVGEGEHALLVAVVVLQRDLDFDIALLAFEEHDLRMNRCFVLVQVLHELDDAALEEERVAPAVVLVLDDDLQSAVQERQLAQPIRERIERELADLEDRRVRLESDDGAVLGRLLARRQRAGRHPALLVALRPHLAAAADLDVEPLAQRVDDGDADAVQAARDLVGRVLELAAGVQHGQHDFRRRLARLLVRVDGNPAAVVADGDGIVGVQDDFDRVAEAGERLVDGIVDDLVDQVVQAVGARVADVHGGALADGLEAFEHLDVARGVRVCAHAADTSPDSTIQRAAPFTASGSGDVRNTCSALWISRRTLPPTIESSSDNASSRSSTGAVPAASVTGSTSASRSASARSRCSPREPNARVSVPFSSMARSSRCGPTSVRRRRISSARRRSRAARSAAGSVASPRLVRYATSTLWRSPARIGYTRASSVESAATARRRRSMSSMPVTASCSSQGASRPSAPGTWSSRLRRARIWR